MYLELRANTLESGVGEEEGAEEDAQVAGLSPRKEGAAIHEAEAACGGAGRRARLAPPVCTR